jgi:hypothetical protein
MFDLLPNAQRVRSSLDRVGDLLVLQKVYMDFRWYGVSGEPYFYGGLLKFDHWSQSGEIVK